MAVQRKDHPVIAGLVAMVAVSLAIALILGVAALLASRTLGLDDTSTDTAAGDETSLEGGETMYLPPLKPTEQSTGPLVTLAPPDPTESRSTNTAGATTIVLSAGQTSVAPMQQIDLTGSAPGMEGAILSVERFENGAWQDFVGITANVVNGTFSTYIQTGQIGESRFRVVDTDTGAASNEVVITIG